MKTTKIRVLFLAGVTSCYQGLAVQAAYIDGLSVGANQTVTINFNDTAVNIGGIGIGGTLNNQGSVTLKPYIGLSGIVNNFGLFTTKDITYHGKVINHPGGHMVMTGYIDMYSVNSSFENKGKVSVVKGVGDGGNVPGPSVPFTYIFRGPITNSGSFLIDRNNGENICSQGGVGTITNSGIFEIAKDTLCNFTEYPEEANSKATYIQTGGETKVNGVFGAHSIQIKSGVVSGIGTLEGLDTDSALLFPTVTLAPGAPFGTLTLTPRSDINYAICIGCATDIELGASPNARDHLHVNGDLYLNNWKLNVITRNFVPAVGTEFSLVSADSITFYGPAATYNLPKLPNGRTWTVQNTGTSIVLRAN